MTSRLRMQAHLGWSLFFRTQRASLFLLGTTTRDSNAVVSCSSCKGGFAGHETLHTVFGRQVGPRAVNNNWTMGNWHSRGADPSQQYAEQLIQPALDSPPPLDELQKFMEEAPVAQIPITVDFQNMVILPPAIAQHFTAARGELACAVGHSLASPLPPEGSELCTALMEHAVVVSLLLALDGALPSRLRIGLKMERDKQDTTSLMTIKSMGGTSLRPDGVLRTSSGRRLLVKWEDKAASMEAAVEDLRKKTAAWTPLYYGDIEYLPCFAAAGRNLQFYAISWSNGMAAAPRAISSCYDLARARDRAEAVMATIKFYQLLCAQNARYPPNVLPAGAVMSAQGPGFTRELLFRTDVLEVRKVVSPWAVFAAWSGVDFKKLKKLYRATAKRQGLVHIASKDALTLRGDVYTVDLIPVGLPSRNAWPTTEDEARLLLHGLLHGLAAIHEAGFVHRDLRWDNFACSPASPRRWFLLDLETCAPADQSPPPTFEPAGWQSGTTLVHGLYTRASDLYQLWVAVQPRCEQVVVSAEGRAFLEAIATPPAQQTRSAAELLAHEWLRCDGAGLCRAAGAQTGER